MKKLFLLFIMLPLLSYAKGVEQCNLPNYEAITDDRTGRTREFPIGQCDGLDWAVSYAKCKELATKAEYDCYQLTFSSKGTTYCYGCFK